MLHWEKHPWYRLVGAHHLPGRQQFECILRLAMTPPTRYNGKYQEHSQKLLKYHIKETRNGKKHLRKAGCDTTSIG